MSAAIVLTPASGSITNTVSTVRVNVTGASTNDITTYDTTKRPEETPYTYYLLFSAPAGGQDKKSYLFNVSADGNHEFNSFVFDKAGTWTVRLRNAADDSDVTTASVVVA